MEGSTSTECATAAPHRAQNRAFGLCWVPHAVQTDTSLAVAIGDGSGPETWPFRRRFTARIVRTMTAMMTSSGTKLSGPFPEELAAIMFMRPRFRRANFPLGRGWSRTLHMASRPTSAASSTGYRAIYSVELPRPLPNAPIRGQAGATSESGVPTRLRRSTAIGSRGGGNQPGSARQQDRDESPLPVTLGGRRRQPNGGHSCVAGGCPRC